MVKSYLTNRYASLTIEKTEQVRKLTRGCPQGSQLSPALWKVAMSVFKIYYAYRVLCDIPIPSKSTFGLD